MFLVDIDIDIDSNSRRRMSGWIARMSIQESMDSVLALPGSSRQLTFMDCWDGSEVSTEVPSSRRPGGRPMGHTYPGEVRGSWLGWLGNPDAIPTGPSQLLHKSPSHPIPHAKQHYYSALDGIHTRALSPSQDIIESVNCSPTSGA